MQTSGPEGYEPKYGFLPLIFGTLKATFYSLLVGVPLRPARRRLYQRISQSVREGDCQTDRRDDGESAERGARFPGRDGGGAVRRTLAGNGPRRPVHRPRQRSRSALMSGNYCRRRSVCCCRAIAFCSSCACCPSACCCDVGWPAVGTGAVSRRPQGLAQWRFQHAGHAGLVSVAAPFALGTTFLLLAQIVNPWLRHARHT